MLLHKPTKCTWCTKQTVSEQGKEICRESFNTQSQECRNISSYLTETWPLCRGQNRGDHNWDVEKSKKAPPCWWCQDSVSCGKMDWNNEASCQALLYLCFGRFFFHLPVIEQKMRPLNMDPVFIPLGWKSINAFRLVCKVLVNSLQGFYTF